MISGKPKAIECDQQAPDGIFPKFRRAAMRIHAARLHACSVCRYLFRQRSLHAVNSIGGDADTNAHAYSYSDANTNTYTYSRS